LTLLRVALPIKKYTFVSALNVRVFARHNALRYHHRVHPVSTTTFSKSPPVYYHLFTYTSKTTLAWKNRGLFFPFVYENNFVCAIRLTRNSFDCQTTTCIHPVYILKRTLMYVILYNQSERNILFDIPFTNDSYSNICPQLVALNAVRCVR